MANTLFKKCLLLGQNQQLVYFRFRDPDNNILAPVDIASAGIFNSKGEQLDVEKLTRIIGTDPGGVIYNTPNQPPTFDEDGSVTGVNGGTGGPGFYYYRLNLTDDDLKGSTPDCPYYIRIIWNDGTGVVGTNVRFHMRHRKDLSEFSVHCYTPYIYTTPHDVLSLLKLDDKNRLYTEAVEDGTFNVDEIVRLIMNYEGQYDHSKQTSYRIRFQQDEVEDIEQWRQRLPEMFGGSAFSPRPLGLLKGPLLPFDPSRQHRIEFYKGSSTLEGNDPVSRWTDYMKLRPEGRNLGRWMDWRRAILYVREAFLLRRASGTRISYEYGKPITWLTTPLYRDECQFMAVETSWRYEGRSIKRVQDEYVMTTGKSADGFYNLKRGMFGTKVVDHPAGCEVYEIPDEVRDLVTKRVAADFVSTDWYNAVLGSGTNSTVNWSALAESWKAEWDREMEKGNAWGEF